MDKKWAGLINVGAVCYGTYLLYTVLGLNLGLGIGLLVWALLPWQN